MCTRCMYLHHPALSKTQSSADNMSGASGLKTKLSRKWARAMLYAMKETFPLLSHDNQPSSCQIMMEGSAVMGDKCKKGELLKITYTDSTGYLSVYLANADNKKIMINIMHHLCSITEALQDGTFDGHCSYLVEDIVESIPITGENKWWEEVKPPKKGPDTPAALARSLATVESSATDGPHHHYRRGSEGLYPTTSDEDDDDEDGKGGKGKGKWVRSRINPADSCSAGPTSVQQQQKGKGATAEVAPVGPLWSKDPPPQKGSNDTEIYKRDYGWWTQQQQSDRFSSSSRTQRTLLTEEEELLNDCALQACEYLQEWPAVQNRVIKAFKEAGARVKVENDFGQPLPGMPNVVVAVPTAPLVSEQVSDILQLLVVRRIIGKLVAALATTDHGLAPCIVENTSEETPTHDFACQLFAQGVFTASDIVVRLLDGSDISPGSGNHTPMPAVLLTHQEVDNMVAQHNGNLFLLVSQRHYKSNSTWRI